MRTMMVAVALFGLVACAGEETKPAVDTTPAVVTPPPAPPVVAPPVAPPAAAAFNDADFAKLSDADKKAWLMTKGEDVYKNGGTGGIACVTCHQPDGKGVPSAFPPLAGSKDQMGDCQHHAGLVVFGLSGEIHVGGATFSGVMPPQDKLPDNEIAAAITYERNSFGNDFGPCMPADVAAARKLPAPTVK